MYDRILFPTDGSEPAKSALDYALQIAAEHDATIHVLNVVDESPTGVRGELRDTLEQEGTEIVTEAAGKATDRGITAVTAVVHGDPHEAISEYRARQAIELIVMPTQGRRGLQRVLLGSVTERVINTATVPVIAINPVDRTPTYPCREVLVPTDGSRGSERALSEGAALASATGATLHILHVVETAGLGPDVRSLVEPPERPERADEVIEAALETAAAASVENVEHAVEFGGPAKEIRNYIEANGIALAVLGTHGQTDFSRYMMGGVSAKIVRTSPVPVMWVREPESNGG